MLNYQTKTVHIQTPLGLKQQSVKEDVMIEIGENGDILNLLFKDQASRQYTIKGYSNLDTIEVHLAAHVKILQQISNP